jgi:hypothetical protein
MDLSAIRTQSDTYSIRIHMWFAPNTSVKCIGTFQYVLTNWFDRICHFDDIHFGKYLSRVGTFLRYLRSYMRCRADCSTDNPMNSVEKSSKFQAGVRFANSSPCVLLYWWATTALTCGFCYYPFWVIYICF